MLSLFFLLSFVLLFARFRLEPLSFLPRLLHLPFLPRNRRPGIWLLDEIIRPWPTERPWKPHNCQHVKRVSASLGHACYSTQVLGRTLVLLLPISHASCFVRLVGPEIGDLRGGVLLLPLSSALLPPSSTPAAFHRRDSFFIMAGTLSS